METNNVLLSQQSGDSFNLKALNKLGATFFALFLVGSFLPLYSILGEDVSLYYMSDSNFLFIFAAIGFAVFLSGVSRKAARLTSLLFIGFIIVGTIVTAVDTYKEMREAAGFLGGYRAKVGFNFAEFVEALSIKDMAKDAVSVASVLLIVSFVGILGCMFSPRYKENQALRAKLFGAQIDNTANEVTSAVSTAKAALSEDRQHVEKESQAERESQKEQEEVKTEQALVGGFWGRLLQKTLNGSAFVYAIVEPVLLAYLNKGTDLISRILPNLNPDYVRMALFGGLIIAVLLLVF